MAGPDLLEVEASPTDPYVQQQVIYTVRLYRRVQISNAALSEPGSDADAIIKQLEKDKSYAGRHDGKRYEVFERRYAFYPQTSGRVTLEPMTLTAQIVAGRRSFFDPFGQSLNTKWVASEAITLEGKPIPATFTGKTWLPARRLTLDEEWNPLEPTVTAGEPLTRTLFLWADGLSGGQLPDLELSLPMLVKFQHYLCFLQSYPLLLVSGFSF